MVDQNGQTDRETRNDGRADRRDLVLLELEQARARRYSGHLRVRLPSRLPVPPPPPAEFPEAGTPTAAANRG